jgi:hypothetical protein
MGQHRPGMEHQLFQQTELRPSTRHACRAQAHLARDGVECKIAQDEWALRAPYASLDEVARALGAPVPTGTELAQGLDQTWRFMADRLARWTPADLRQTFPDEEDGTPVDVPRAWVVWHVLEHDLHHGGELSLTLGMHGIRAEFAL